MSLVDQIMRSRRLASRVKRYHTWPTIREQTVADHTFNMMRVYTEVFGVPPSTVWECILWHDITEMYTGDIPSFVKRDNPKLAGLLHELENKARINMQVPTVFGLPAAEFTQIKIADLLEMWEFGREEMMLGNKYAEPVVTRASWAAQKLAEEIEVLERVERWQNEQL